MCLIVETCSKWYKVIMSYYRCLGSLSLESTPWSPTFWPNRGGIVGYSSGAPPPDYSSCCLSDSSSPSIEWSCLGTSKLGILSVNSKLKYFYLTQFCELFILFRRLVLFIIVDCLNYILEIRFFLHNVLTNTLRHTNVHWLLIEHVRLTFFGNKQRIISTLFYMLTKWNWLNPFATTCTLHGRAVLEYLFKIFNFVIFLLQKLTPLLHFLQSRSHILICLH